MIHPVALYCLLFVLCVGSCDYLNHKFEKNEDIAYLISEQTVYILSLASKFQSNIANSLALIL